VGYPFKFHGLFFRVVMSAGHVPKNSRPLSHSTWGMSRAATAILSVVKKFFLPVMIENNIYFYMPMYKEKDRHCRQREKRSYGGRVGGCGGRLSNTFSSPNDNNACI